MEILGVGIPEIGFIVLIALILLGPKDMIAAGKTIGSFLRKILTSPTWLAMRKTGEELQQLPTKLVREAGLDELQKEIQGVTNQLKPIDLRKSFDESQIFSLKPATVLPKVVVPSVPDVSQPLASQPLASEPPTIISETIPPTES